MRRFYSDWRQGNKVYVYTVPRLNKERQDFDGFMFLLRNIFSCGTEDFWIRKTILKSNIACRQNQGFFYLGAVYCQNKNLQCVNAAKYTSAISIQYPEGSLVKSFAESGSYMYICNNIFRLKSTEILQIFNSINHFKF